MSTTVCSSEMYLMPNSRDALDPSTKSMVLIAWSCVFGWPMAMLGRSGNREWRTYTRRSVGTPEGICRYSVERKRE
jgi:hypothetical protein